MRPLKDVYKDAAEAAARNLRNSHKNYAAEIILFYAFKCGGRKLLDRMEHVLLEGKLPRNAMKKLKQVIEETRTEIENL